VWDEGVRVCSEYVRLGCERVRLERVRSIEGEVSIEWIVENDFAKWEVTAPGPVYYQYTPYPL
jgi:hypothetical protein